METNTNTPIARATTRLDKIQAQWETGRLTLSDFESQRLIILLDLVAESRD